MTQTQPTMEDGELKVKNFTCSIHGVIKPKPICPKCKHQTLIEKLRESEEEKQAIIETLFDMYGQYCGDGHDFMSAGEGAVTVLEKYGYKFDDCGRFINLTPKGN